MVKAVIISFSVSWRAIESGINHGHRVPRPIPHYDLVRRRRYHGHCVSLTKALHASWSILILIGTIEASSFDRDLSWANMKLGRFSPFLLRFSSCRRATVPCSDIYLRWLTDCTFLNHTISYNLRRYWPVLGGDIGLFFSLQVTLDYDSTKWLILLKVRSSES
jgi:hypothetical protein